MELKLTKCGGLKKDVTGGLKVKKENVISGLSRGDFWQPLIAPEARKECWCQSFSAPHIGPRADCPFHRPAFFRPALTFCTRMRSCARANDAKIERSRDVQCSTKALVKRRVIVDDS